MIKYFLFSIFFTSSIWAQTSSIESFYYFGGQKIKLDPYLKQAPRAEIKKSLSNTSLASLPDLIDLKLFQTSVKNQGERGSCAFFASNSLIESLIKKNQNMEVNLSEEYLIWKVKVEYGSSSAADGSFADENMKGAQKAGFVLERDMPYQPSWFAKGLPCAKYSSSSAPISCYAHNQPSNSVLAKVISSRALVPEVYMKVGSDKIMSLLASGQPVIIGVPVNPNGWNENTGVVIFNEALRQECDSKPGFCGGHAILLVGYDKNARQFIFKNSWGITWGKNGYGTISYDYVDKYSHDKSVSAHLNGFVNLPNDYDQIPTKNLEVRLLTTSLQNTSDGKNAVIQVQGRAESLHNYVFYASSFLTSPAKIDMPISEENIFYVPVLKNFQNQYGPILRDGISRLFKSNEVVAEVNALLTLPLKTADRSAVPVANYYLRTSVYYYTDIDGWKVVQRNFDPIAF